MIPRVEIKNLKKSFYKDDGEIRVLEDISLALNDGEFVSILGPSGSGKSTIFNIICGIEKSYSGSIMVDGLELKERQRKFAYMPQKDLLMPWKNLRDNISIPLDIQGISKAESEKKIQELLPLFGLNGFEKAYPSELSGGMRQRAALLRTFLIDSDIMLLDEPFGALDAISRDKMQRWLLDIWEKFRRSVLFITHSIDESIYLSDRVYVLSERPASIKLELKVDIPRPRSKDILTSDRFIEYKALLLDTLE